MASFNKIPTVAAPSWSRVDQANGLSQTESCRSLCDGYGVDIASQRRPKHLEMPFLKTSSKIYDTIPLQKFVGIRQWETHEITKLDNELPAIIKKCSLSEEDIVRWAGQSGQTPKSGFRLNMLIGKMVDDRLKDPLPHERVRASRTLLDEAATEMGLSSDAIISSYHKGFACFQVLPASEITDDMIYILDIVSGAFTIGWRYNNVDRVATCILLYNEWSCDKLLTKFNGYLQDLDRYIELPMLLSYIGNAIRFEQTWYLTEKRKVAVRQAEARTGYTFLGEEHPRLPGVKPPRAAPSDKDLDKNHLDIIMMENKSFSAVNINAKRRLLQMESDSQLMLKENRYFLQITLKNHIEMQQRACLRLEGYFGYLLHVIHSRILFAQASQDRASIQLQELSNIINRRDQGISIEIAESSRRDNRAVKALAVLAMICLPGTLVSSLFNMTFFDWSPGPGESVVKKQFWIYWAFTVPLTLVICLICWGLCSLSSKKARSGLPVTENQDRETRRWISISTWKGGMFWDDDPRESTECTEEVNKEVLRRQQTGVSTLSGDTAV